MSDIESSRVESLSDSAAQEREPSLTMGKARAKAAAADRRAEVEIPKIELSEEDGHRLDEMA